MINKKRVLKTFFEYVKIDSETLNEKEMADKIKADLEQIGLDVHIDNAGSNFGSNSGNVYCYIEGDKTLEPLMISAHIDTVTPGKNIEPFVDDDGYIKSKGNTILGSDDKSGVVAIVEALRVIKERKLNNRPIEAVFTIAEEGGLRGAKHLDLNDIKSKNALILDSSGDTGHIIVAAPGQTKIIADIIGKKSHAGIAPENGISSIQVMSEAISNMKLLRIDDETTANIGSFTAQGPTNIVCEKSSIIAEARSRNVNKLNKQTNHMVDCLKNACEKHNAKLDLTVQNMYEPYTVSENDELLKFVEAKMKQINITPSTHTSGGGSDSNVYNKNGIKTIVLGTGMDKVHTTEERIKVSELENIAKLTLQLMIK